MKKIVIGANIFENCTNPIVIFGMPLFSLKKDSESLKLSFNVPAPPNKTSVKIEDNKILEGNINIRVDANTASVFLRSNDSKPDAKIFEIILKDDVAWVNFDLRPLSLHIYTNQNALFIGGSQLSGNTFAECENGIVIGE